jgi:predicted acyl esterase
MAARSYPGEITEITFELMPVSVVVRAGHRLRIAIAGADADTLRRIPEEGAPIIMVYRSAARASHITLPIMRRQKKVS